MNPSPLVDLLKQIYPLIVASGVSLAIAPLVVVQTKPEKLSPITKHVNEWGTVIGEFFSIIALLFALLYAFTPGSAWLIYLSLILIVTTVCILITAFLTPVIINAIPYLWKRTYYHQFKDAQSKDLDDLIGDSTEG